MPMRKTPAKLCHHRKIVCKCGAVIADCSCPSPKALERVNNCLGCENRILGETPKQQRARIAMQLSRLINDFNGDNQAAGIAVFEWLIDARMQVEDLKKEIARNAAHV